MNDDNHNNYYKENTIPPLAGRINLLRRHLRELLKIFDTPALDTNFLEDDTGAAVDEIKMTLEILKDMSDKLLEDYDTLLDLVLEMLEIYVDEDEEEDLIPVDGFVTEEENEPFSGHFNFTKPIQDALDKAYRKYVEEHESEDESTFSIGVDVKADVNNDVNNDVKNDWEYVPVNETPKIIQFDFDAPECTKLRDLFLKPDGAKELKDLSFSEWQDYQNNNLDLGEYEEKEEFDADYEVKLKQEIHDHIERLQETVRESARYLADAVLHRLLAEGRVSITDNYTDNSDKYCGCCKVDDCDGDCGTCECNCDDCGEY